jgi:aquaporin Z
MSSQKKLQWKLYLMEAFGLSIFMISACFFSALLGAKTSYINAAIPNAFIRLVIMGVMMGITALIIFYSPWTSPSGAQINPAVTLSFLRLGTISKQDAFFYIIFQFVGGTITVYIMQALMGGMLTDPPVNSAVTVPGKGISTAVAGITEFAIAFCMITMILFTSASKKLKKYTRIFAGCFVCLYVIISGPVSGFGMNPARTFASALPAHIWTAFWLYVIAPIGGMLLATEFFIYCTNHTLHLSGFTIYKQKDPKKQI